MNFQRVFLIVVQSLSWVQLFVTPWTVAHQAPLFFTISWTLRKFMSIKSVMLSNHLILCSSLFLLPSVFPSIRVFSSESALQIRWPKYWSFSFSISLSNEYSGLIPLRIPWGLVWFPWGLVWSPCYPRDSQESPSAPQSQPSLWFSSHIHTWLLEKP